MGYAGVNDCGVAAKSQESMPGREHWQVTK